MSRQEGFIGYRRSVAEETGNQQIKTGFKKAIILPTKIDKVGTGTGLVEQGGDTHKNFH